jgi:hypothetical protein
MLPTAELRLVRARIRAALPELAGVDALLHWLDGLPQGTPDLQLHLAASANVERVTLSAVGPTATLLGRTARFLAEAGVSEHELRRFATACEALQPEVLGSWVEVGPAGIDGGWVLPGPWPLASVRDLLPEGESTDQLWAWASAHEVEQCLVLKRAAGEQALYVELVLPLPPGSVRSQFVCAADAADRLGAEGWPQPLRDAVEHHARGALALSVWLVPDGLAKLGLWLPGPAPELQAALLGLLGEPEAAADQLTAALGSAGPTQLELQELPEGLDLELHFGLGEPPSVD